MDLGAFAALDLREDADAAQQMLVDRVVVIHVELHHRDDLAEFGDQPAEHAGLVHAAQVQLRIAVRGQNVEKQPVGLGVLAQIAGDQLQRTGDQLHRVGMIFEAVLVGEPEQPQQIDRVALEHHVVGDVDAVIVDDEVAGAGKLAPAPREPEEQAVEARHFLGLLLLQRRAEDAGQVADILGDQEIVLHEALDRRQAGMAGVAEPLGDLALDVEMQPLLGLAGEEVHVAAHGPQEVFGLQELVVFVVREDALLGQLVAAANPVEILADPEQRLQVAQAALAVLDVRLDEVAALAGLAMALVALGELGLRIFGAAVLHHFAVEAPDQLVVDGLVAPQEAGFEDRRADRVVGARQADALVDVAGGVADLQARGPTACRACIRRSARPTASACRAARTADRCRSRAPACRGRSRRRRRSPCVRRPTGSSTGTHGPSRSRRARG